MSSKDAKPKVTAIAPWFGSKRTLAPEIVRELGPHSAFWEPFCGSMAVLLCKPPVPMETVNDLHGDLINVAKVIQHAQLGPALYRRLRRTLMHESLNDLCAGRYRERGNAPAGEPDIDRAYDYFVSAWMGRNGVAGTESYNQGFCVRYTKNGGHAGTRFTSCVNSIPAWRHRLAHVTILNRDGFELLERIEDANGVAIYLDPPYVRKGAKYVHDFADVQRHKQLADLAHRFKRTRVVVSYYAEPELAEWYPGWTVRPLKATKAMVNQGMRDKSGATEAPEVLLINGPSLVEKAEKLFA